MLQGAPTSLRIAMLTSQYYSRLRLRTASEGTLIVVLLIVAGRNAGAQRLPFHNYSVRNGLAHAHVNAVYQGSEGFSGLAPGRARCPIFVS